MSIRGCPVTIQVGTHLSPMKTKGLIRRGGDVPLVAVLSLCWCDTMVTGTKTNELQRGKREGRGRGRL